MGEVDNTVMFREAFVGYSKKDVNKYLEKISGDFMRREEEHEELLSRVRRELDEEKKKNSEIAARLDEMACEVYACGMKAEEAGAVIEKLKAERAELNVKLDEMACEAYASQERESQIKTATAELCGRIAELEARPDTQQLTDELYAKMNGRIDEMLSAAQTRGDEIIANARREAENIRAQADTETQLISDKMKNIYKDAATEYYDEVTQFAEEIKCAVNALLRDIGTKSAEFNGKIDYMRLESENAARSSGVVAGTAAEISEKPHDGQKQETAKESPKKKELHSLDEKIENFFRNAMSQISSVRDKK